jgi:hypothetical protein
MKRFRVIFATAIFAFASAANAQSVTSRVTGTVGEIGSSIAGQASAGTGPNGSRTLGDPNLPTNSQIGGELPGGAKMKLGDKVIDLRGNVGVGNNGGNFKAGVGLPF